MIGPFIFGFWMHSKNLNAFIFRGAKSDILSFLQNWFWPATKNVQNSANMCPLELSNAFGISSNGGTLAELWPFVVGASNEFCKNMSNIMTNTWSLGVLWRENTYSFEAPSTNGHNSANMPPLELIPNALESWESDSFSKRFESAPTDTY